MILTFLSYQHRRWHGIAGEHGVLERFMIDVTTITFSSS